MKEMEEKRTRLKMEALRNDPKITLRPQAVYKYTRPLDADAKYESANMRANMIEQDMERMMERKPNSREQYNYEKRQGGPMTDLSYEEWKKLD
jgi:hypothetical protein